MGKFKAVPGLDDKVAHMVAPEVRKVALKVELNAKRFAPPTKTWVSMADALVRDTHREAHALPAIPANLRFAVRGQPWDIEHGLSPGVDYLLRPRDTSTGLPLDSVQHVHCRCHEAFQPLAIADKVVTGPAEVYNATVRVVVSCTAYKVVECEYGETYPTEVRAPGTRFMARAAAAAAGRSSVTVPRGVDTGIGNYTEGGEDN